MPRVCRAPCCLPITAKSELARNAVWGGTGSMMTTGIDGRFRSSSAQSREETKPTLHVSRLGPLMGAVLAARVELCLHALAPLESSLAALELEDSNQSVPAMIHRPKGSLRALALSSSGGGLTYLISSATVWHIIRLPSGLFGLSVAEVLIGQAVPALIVCIALVLASKVLPRFSTVAAVIACPAIVILGIIGWMLFERAMPFSPGNRLTYAIVSPLLQEMPSVIAGILTAGSILNRVAPKK